MYSTSFMINVGLLMILQKSVAKDKKSIGSVSNGVNLKLRNGAANDTKKSR